MKTMKQIIFLLSGVLYCAAALAQGPPPHYGGNRMNRGGDTSQVLQKPEKGPNHGRMLLHNGIKVEIVTPSNPKKPEVQYFVFDSLNNPLDAKLFVGTVKYVFGGPNQYLEANMIAAGKRPNQYFTSLEDWRDCKHMIVTLKENGKMRATMMFMNTDAPPPKSTDSGDHQHQGRQNGGGMNPGGMMNGGMNGGGMGGGMNNGMR